MQNENMVLLERIQNGDRQALLEVFEKYWERCTKTFLEFGHPEDTVTDLLVELFLSVPRNSARIRDLDEYIVSKSDELNKAKLFESLDEEHLPVLRIINRNNLTT